LVFKYKTEIAEKVFFIVIAKLIRRCSNLKLSRFWDYHVFLLSQNFSWWHRNL